ncbi:Copia protein [Symbiodinium microadriaticum]|uniref:Copia protein n=1 Tax=Symbiodinium microadriaticum TaxID=2951 RepID=A0A1Q9DXK0_SYMMI|nr:Copia protein [Symbiodinium microadriaticum]OLP99886.1 Copia protein [Symbiodinium microadriaticum]
MAAEPAADPWSAPNSDPWASGGWTDGTSANAAAESEPNADYSANALTADGPQSRENQESGESATAPRADSWTDWTNRRADSSSDGSSGDTTAPGDRRASDGSWGTWTSRGTWHPEWHGGWWNRWGGQGYDWHSGHWGERDAATWTTSTATSAGTTPTWTHGNTYTAEPSTQAWTATSWMDNGARSTCTPSPSSMATTGPPSSTRPWSTSTHGHGGEDRGVPVGGGGKGPSEKLLIPSFSGDGDGAADLGTSARSYLRQVAAWEKMTKLSRDQRALVLYQNLQGSAWVNAESLSVNELAQEGGVDYLKDWIRQHYLDVEVTQVGRSLSDLFRKLRRKPSQTFRDYTAEFNRLLARVTECGCTLPDVANAWLYVDRANLDETTEVSLLASVGNKYALRVLQQAAIVLDRSMRKPWEKGGRETTGGRRYNSVNHAEDGYDDNEDLSDGDELLEDRLDQDTGELYITYMTAKAKYKDAAKARGTTEIGNKASGPKFNPANVKKAAEAKILLAKSKSHCASCGQRGHWHKDPECPNRAAADKAQTVHVTNEIFELTTCKNGEPLYAILDSACSKTVVGTAWLERYLGAVKGRGFEVDFVYERECFRFGAASRIYESTYAAIILTNILGKWVAVKAAVVHGDLPLLMSRPALGHLGLVLDLGMNRARFRKLSEGELELIETSSGHPAVLIESDSNQKPDMSQLPKSWEAHGTAVLSSREVYMTSCAGDGDVGKQPFIPASFRGMSQAAPATSVWKMTKVELLSECNRRGLAVNAKWTCPELRTVLNADSEHNRGTSTVPKGLSSMNLAELKAEADRLGIHTVAKETRGSLMLKVRDAMAPDSTVMTIGRFRGSSYVDIPENYASWASEEERQNGDNMSPDLKRFVMWRRHRRTLDAKETTVKRHTKNPEKNTKVPPPPLSETGSSAWGVVEDPNGELSDWRPIPPSTAARTGYPNEIHDSASSTTSMSPWMTSPWMPKHMTTTRPKARAARRDRSPEERGPMEQEIDEATYSEIQELEDGYSGAGMVPKEENSFRSCSSGSDDGVEEVFISKGDLAKIGEDVAGVRHHHEHPGELAAAGALREQDFSYERLSEILRQYDFEKCPVRRQGIHLDAGGTRVAFGYYAYGSFKGVCKNSARWANLTCYLNAFLTEHAGGEGQERASWSAITVLSDCPASMHTDKNNLKGSSNYVTSWGDGSGGGLWIERQGGGTWRRGPDGQEIEGEVLDTNRQVWEFDPRLRHASEPATGQRWTVAAYTPRTYPDANKTEKKLLRGLGFPLPTAAEVREARRRHEAWSGNRGTAGENLATTTPTTRPRRSQRRTMWKTVAFLSVMYSTAMSAMGQATQEAVPTGSFPDTALLEVGGLSATCRAGEYCGEHVRVVEPILPEDLLHNEHPRDLPLGYVETAVIRHRPGQLWIHASPVMKDLVIYSDVVEAIGRQLSEGRAVVIERNIEEDDVWDRISSGWGEAGYFTQRDRDEDGNELLRVIYHDDNLAAYEVLAEGVGEGEEPNRADEEMLEEADAEAKESPDGHAGGAVVHLPEGDLREPGGERGAKAIKFPANVPGRVASSLRRLHQNLGHPSPIDFARHLRLAGASREVLKAAKGLECEVCRRAKAPAIAKPAKIAPCLRFNQMIGADLLYVHDTEGVRHQLLSLVDFSSTYHVMVPVARKDTASLEKAYCENWLNVFGAPAVIAVDLENGLEKALARVGDWTGTRIRNAAGQAHYQAGFTERQGGIWKATFAKLCEELNVTKGDITVAIGAVSSAKNRLAKVSGYSPFQHVFGAQPNDPEDLLYGPHANNPNEEAIIDDRHAQEVAIRSAARAAFFHVQTDERVRRALSGRTRVTSRAPECGERVFYYRKTKNNKRGMWMGPGTVIGYEGVNAWVTRGGRCVLCAPEHLRLATPEELGEAFSLRAAREDLDKLLNLDDDEDAFEEEDAGYGIGEVEYEQGDMDVEEPETAEVEHGEPPEVRQGLRRGPDAPPPVVLKRQRRKGRPEDAQAVFMMKKARTQRSRDKALEKEIPWALIPEEMRASFRAAEAKQWSEHVDSKAITVLTIAESERVRSTVPPERILSTRYAYKDKHMGLRRANPEVAWKPKARLVVGGHADPDLQSGELTTDSPTVARSSMLSVLQVCASRKWCAAAGDIQAAFLQGVELQRDLWIAQPRGGVESLDPRQLAKVNKGIFGLTESPRMWYDRLSGVLTTEIFKYQGIEYRLVPSPLDACVLMMMRTDDQGEPEALLTIHVDDIMIAAPTEMNRYLQKEISRLFPVDDWIENSFEYTGSLIHVSDSGITVNQATFVDGRLFTVDVPKNQDGKMPADEEQTIDNRSLLGALSWLSSQSRPDLACGVAMSQQLQRSPLTDDVRFVNRLVSRAKEHRDCGIHLRPVPLDKAIFVVYHDAGWANADLEEAEEDFKLNPIEIQDGTIHDFYDKERERKPKRAGSKVASQIGHLIMLFHADVIDGVKEKGSVLEWRSQSCKRVCRSTFGAETMAAAEGLEGGQYMRALFGTLLTGRLMNHAQARARWPLLCLSDCKSLFDFLHKAGAPKVPSDRRLAIDLAALRQELKLEKWAERLPFQWIPTTIQLADPLTKPKRVEGWWEAIRDGVELPFKRGLFRRGEENFNQCKREGSERW